MTLADHLAFLADADSPLGRLRTEAERPGQAGSSGVVFPAVDPETDRRLALKLVRGRVAQDPAVLEAARADAVAQTALDHPRIAALYESGHMPAGFYLLMAWLDGRPLDAVLRGGPMDPWAALTVVRDVAEAVEVAHAAGIVHRDLTPGKIVVSEGGRAALGDLGAGRRRAGEPLPLASLDYVSPEQVREEPPTQASHEYSLACILFHCLTGEAPFARARASAKTFWHIRAPRPLPGEHRSGLPPAVDAVVVRSMSIDPAERHGSPAALASQLATALGPRPEPEESRVPVPARRPRPVSASTFSSWSVDDATTRAKRPAAAAPSPASAEPAGRFDWTEDASGPGRLAWLAGGALALVAAAAVVTGGLLAGRQTKDPPVAAQPGAVGTSQLAFVRPAGWRRLDPPPPVPGLDATEGVAVAPRGSSREAIVAALATPGRDGLLPDALVKALPEPPGRGDPVRLGDLQGFRFRDLQPDGDRGPMTLYAVPTNDGTVAIACMGGVDAGICDGQAATLQLTGPKPVPVQPAERYADAVAQAFRKLNRTRDRALADLAKAGTRTAQSRAAGRLGGAYALAAGRLRGAPDRRFVLAANEAIVAALDRAARAYRSMAYNAGRGDESGYAVARTSAIAAERRVERALRRLEDAGYRVR